jgi:peptidoglycan/xylan/chitin deacetylase (PgdA/CDA1 family)
MNPVRGLRKKPGGSTTEFRSRSSMTRWKKMTTARGDNEPVLTRHGPIGPAQAGRDEVRRCREVPGHRAHSLLRRLLAGPRWSVALRIRIACSAWFRRGLPAFSGARGEVQAKLPLFGLVAKRFRQFRDSLVFLAAAIEEAGGWEAFREEFARRVPVLCYHHVGSRAQGSWPLLTLSPAALERQMEWLQKRGYTGISASDWLAWLETGAPLPEKPVVITFDDAYSDLVQTAIPILRHHHFKATLFLVSQHIGGASTWDAGIGYPSRPLMNAADILRAMRYGVEVGSHTRTHRDLRKVSANELRTELDLSRQELGRLTGAPVRTLAYPFGFENSSVRAAAAKFYDLAFGCRSGLNAWASDRHQLRRMFVHRSLLNFSLQVQYGLDLCAVWRFMPEHIHTLWRSLAPRAAKPRDRFPRGTGTANKVWASTSATALSASPPSCPQAVESVGSREV